MNPDDWEAQVNENWVDPINRIRADTIQALQFGVERFPLAMIRPLMAILEQLELLRGTIEAENAKNRGNDAEAAADLAENGDDGADVPQNDPGGADAPV